MGLLQDKTCLITGGAGSIGRASAKLFQDEGARVMLVDLRESDLKRVAEGLDLKRTLTEAADVTNSADMKRAVARTVEAWGKIDVLFSNAGIVGAISPIADYPEDVFDEVLAVHVKGAFLACKYGLPAMNDGGSLIITSSVAGVRGNPGPYGYITAKHAQVGLMRAVAKEAARRHIRVNSLHPGPVDNDFQATVERDLSKVLGRDATEFFNQMIPLGRHARPEEIARAALYLASDMSSFTTGSILMADGGMAG